jgi:glutamyl-tRNA reductase
MADLPLSLIGLDHHRTPVMLRERFAVGDPRELLTALAEQPGCDEVVCLSTCNRFECYIGGTPDRAHLTNLIAERQGVPAELLAQHSYWHSGADCVRHLFRVAASLESLVIGEYQIVQQIKSAYEYSRSANRTGPLLNPLFQRALSVAKDVRSQTDIGKHKLSIASVAVDLARHIHGDLANARLLVIGAGEIAELATKYLVTAGVRELSICNRSQERALELAGTHEASVIPWSDLVHAIGRNDIVVSSTSAPHVVVMEADIRQAMRGRRTPLMLIDLAVPRDIDDKARTLEDVYLYNIDHLESVVAANRQLRGEEVGAASALVDAQAKAYRPAAGEDLAALLGDVAEYFRDVVAAEEARLAQKLGVAGNIELRYGLERVGNKLQHHILRYLREHGSDPNVAATVRAMLGL